MTSNTTVNVYQASEEKKKQTEEEFDWEKIISSSDRYMECCGWNLWSGAYSYDDMRGPQGRFTDVPFEEAFGNILKSVEMMINDPKSDYYYYHPDKVKKR